VGSSSLKRLIVFLLMLLFLTGCSSSGYKTYNVSTHKVRKGETLYSIAWRYDLDYKDVARWNNIRPPYSIYAGQELWLSSRYPSSTTYRGQRASTSSSSSGSAKTQTKRTHTPKATQQKQRKKSDSGGGSYPSGRLTWQWPAAGKIIRTYSTTNQGKKGIDIAGKTGQPVVAAAEGKVVYGGVGLKGYGKLIIIKHNDNFFSAYAHNNKILVKEGTWVKRGQKIAEIGNTDADRTMLHFEIRRNGNPVDPLGYLPKR
jgi:lipoprotein NlpD